MPLIYEFPSTIAQKCEISHKNMGIDGDLGAFYLFFYFKKYTFAPSIAQKCEISHTNMGIDGDIMIIQRDILDQLVKWKNRTDRKPLILQGARQIGKTTTIRAFGSDHYSHIAEFNFDKNKELKRIFETTKDIKRILQELSYFTNAPILANETLIFFDEIQECSEALNALKYFDEDAPEFHVIAAGSLLGVALNREGMSFPVGKVNFIQMYPVTFKEYLRAADEQLFSYAENINEIAPLPEIIANKMEEQYRAYQICGGLPYITSAMLEQQGMEVIEERLQEMLNSYSNDFSKHVEQKDITRIHEIWGSLPSQLSRENKKFIFRTIREGARAREYESALQWLILAGMIYKVVVTEKPQLPLSFYEDTTCFKVYMLDIGLLRKLSRLPAEIITSPNEMFTEFKGAIAENIVLTSLLAQRFDMPHYWTLKGNKAEVDFIVNDRLSILPIEVKAATRISGKSFAEYDKKYSPPLRIRYSLKNLKLDGNLLNIPLYLADWTRQIVGLHHSAT